MSEIEAVKIISSKNWDQATIDKKIKSLSKKNNEGEIYLITDLNIECFLDKKPNQQILSIVLEQNEGQTEVEDFINSLSNLQDYYPSLTIQIIDKSDAISKEWLPNDTAIKNASWTNTSLQE
jgi:hypothetical protein